MSDPRVVLFDLETLPDLYQALKVWPQISNFPGRTLKASVSSVICFGWQVLGDETPQVRSAWDFPEWQTDRNDDRPLLRFAYDILQDAHAVITHNGVKFDWKFLQTRFAIRNIGFLPKIKHIDTKQMLSRNLSLFSNSLDAAADNFGLSRKLDHEGWELWVRTFDRDPAAQQLMADYCKQDVKVLHELFRKLRPFAAKMPNYNLFVTGGSKNLCPYCGSSRLETAGIEPTKTMTYWRNRCLDCGGYSRTDVAGRMPRSI